jgi:hypothetical protein
MKKLPTFFSPKMNQVRQTCDEYLQLVSCVPTKDGPPQAEACATE